MSNYDRAFLNLMKAEGGYVNRSDDRGGETYGGVSRKHHPDWEGWPEVDAYTRGGTLPPRPLGLDTHGRLWRALYTFYRREFWARMGMDYIADAELAELVFEAGVNCGARTAVRWLQESLNLLHQGPDLKVDGLIGPATWKMLKRNRWPEDLKRIYRLMVGRHYISLSEKDPSQEANIRGWVRRISCD